MTPAASSPSRRLLSGPRTLPDIWPRPEHRTGLNPVTPPMGSSRTIPTHFRSGTSLFLFYGALTEGLGVRVAGARA